MGKDSENIIRTIRAGAKQIRSVLENLDAKAVPKFEEHDKRTSERYKYRHKELFADMQQPGEGTSRQFLVEPRNLSEGGMAFLHGGYVHKGTLCTVRLVSLHGSDDHVRGQVVNCRYVEGKIHEVSVKFDYLIEPAQYCAEAVRNRVLLVDDDASVVRLTAAYLKSLNADVDLARDGKSAIEKAISNIYDLILMDIELPTMDGLTATRELRKRGYTGRIVATTARTQPADRQACLDAGCDDYLPKPPTKENLAHILASLDQELLFSTLARNPSMIDLVNAFVDELPPRIRAIEEALVQKDLAKIERQARSLKAEGTSYGFELLTDAAATVEASLIAKCPLEKIQPQVNDLIKLCLQVRTSANLASRSIGGKI